MTVVEHVTFPAGPADLEGRLTYPEEGAPQSGVLLLSPHPHFAGDLDNNVIRALAAGLGERGHAALTFNYRGVGASGFGPPGNALAGESVHDYWQRIEREARYEEIVEDVEAGLRFLADSLPRSTELHLAGYSFGAILAALLVRTPEKTRPAHPASLTLIAPPILRYPLPWLASVSLPRLLLLADDDFLYGEAEIAELRRLPPPVQVTVVPGADHFFRGREDQALQALSSFLSLHLVSQEVS